MKRSALSLLLLMGLTGLAQASDEDEWARALEIPCHPLVTQAECRAHHDQLARLPEGTERDAYLAKHLALVAERVKSCGCAMVQNGVGLLRYR
jgi:hypothetical protein